MGNAESGPTRSSRARVKEAEAAIAAVQRTRARSGFSPNRTLSPRSLDATNDWVDQDTHLTGRLINLKTEKGEVVYSPSSNHPGSRIPFNFRSEEYADDDEIPSSEDEESHEGERLEPEVRNNLDGAMPLVEASAAVYSYIKHPTSPIGDDLSIAERSAAVFEMLENASIQNDPQPIQEFLETASVVSSILTEDEKSISNGRALVFDVLDNQDSRDDASISQKSAAVFQLLENYGQNGEIMSVASNISERSAAIFRVLEQTKSEVDARNISEFSSAVFELLDPPVDPRLEEDEIPMAEQAAAPLGMTTKIPKRDGFQSSVSGGSKRLYSNVTASNPMIPYHLRREMSLPDIVEDRDDIETESMEGESEDDNNEEIDLQFVENFDSAFDEFIKRNPQLLRRNPDLMHQLRIAKLQNLIEHIASYEYNLSMQLKQGEGSQQSVVREFQMQLRQASKRKAARQTTLQTDLGKLTSATKSMRTKMTWDVIDRSERLAKHKFFMQQKHKNALQVMLQSPPTYQEVCREIPEGDNGYMLRRAIAGSYTNSQKEDAETSVNETQLENAFLNAEISVLKKKVAHHQIEAKNHSWVESILLQLNAGTMARLQNKCNKRLSKSKA